MSLLEDPELLTKLRNELREHKNKPDISEEERDFARMFFMGGLYFLKQQVTNQIIKIDIDKMTKGDDKNKKDTE